MRVVSSAGGQVDGVAVDLGEVTGVRFNQTLGFGAINGYNLLATSFQTRVAGKRRSGSRIVDRQIVDRQGASNVSTVDLQIIDEVDGAARSPVLRRAYGRFPSGVVAVCALHDGDPVGFPMSSFVAVSIEPPLVSISVQRTSATWPLLANRPRLGLSVLSDGHDEVCKQLGSKTGDRFAGLPWRATVTGAVVLDGAAAWLECSVHDVIAAGDHDLVLLRLTAMQVHDGVGPLVFHESRFRRLTDVAT